MVSKVTVHKLAVVELVVIGPVVVGPVVVVPVVVGLVVGLVVVKLGCTVVTCPGRMVGVWVGVPSTDMPSRDKISGGQPPILRPNNSTQIWTEPPNRPAMSRIAAAGQPKQINGIAGPMRGKITGTTVEVPDKTVVMN